MAEEEKKEEKIPDPVGDETQKMSKKQFWIRFSLWCVFSTIIPIVYIAVRYNIFTNVDAGMKLSGWGIVATIIIAIFLIRLINSAKKYFPKHTMIAQCIDGYLILLPLVLLALLIHVIKENIGAFENVLVVFIISNAIAVPLNPLRRYGFEHNIEFASGFLTNSIKKALSVKYDNSSGK